MTRWWEEEGYSLFAEGGEHVGQTLRVLDMAAGRYV